MIASHKITLTQRGRNVEVYPWALDAAREIADRSTMTCMVMPDTDPEVFWAELITEYADNSAEPSFIDGSL